MALRLTVLVNVFVQFVTSFYYTECAKKSCVCGVHGPAVSRGIYGERDLPATDSQIRHTGTSAGINPVKRQGVAPLVTSVTNVYYFYVYLHIYCFLQSSEITLLENIKYIPPISKSGKTRKHAF